MVSTEELPGFVPDDLEGLDTLDGGAEEGGGFGFDCGDLLVLHFCEVAGEGREEGGGGGGG